MWKTAVLEKSFVKIAIKRESIRILTEGQLRAARGGQTAETSFDTQLPHEAAGVVGE